MRKFTDEQSFSPIAGPTAAPLLTHRWWMPSAFAILALLLLLIVPAVVDKRISKGRGQLVLAGEYARVLLNDLEASFASQYLVRNSTLSPKDIPAFATRAKLDADRAGLAAVVREIGPKAAAPYNELSDRLDAWDATPRDGTAPTAKQGLELLASAERFDSLLTAMSTARRAEVRRLELARADGELHIDYAATDLAGIVDEVVDDHRAIAREHSVDLAVTARPTPLVTDPVRVRQILANLVSNAIKYTPPGGHVGVSIVDAERAPGHAEVFGVEVRDTGPGIPPELHAKVFEEFFRVRNPAMSVANGNGLGLAISRRIARLLGGDVTLADADGGGAVFTLWFTPSRVPTPGRSRAPVGAQEQRIANPS